ncbi:MAG: D-aminoacyl-tRNA deacylase, partial [bacterium]|nr:D-aminoacyl-tRNA deacylase [bacterium]
MKVVVQRVNSASVKIENKIYSEIKKGVLLLFGVEKNDKKEFIDFLVNKVLNLRIFNDENDKMNLSLNDIKGEILVVSQFTL